MSSILNDFENTLSIDNEEIEKTLIKNRFFAYLYAYVPSKYTHTPNKNDIQNGWLIYHIHIELDHNTLNGLIGLKAINPLIEINKTYTKIDGLVPSKFIEKLNVPSGWCNISEEILYEYQNWKENNSNEIKAKAVENLNNSMIEFYNKFNIDVIN